MDEVKSPPTLKEEADKSSSLLNEKEPHGRNGKYLIIALIGITSVLIVFGVNYFFNLKSTVSEEITSKETGPVISPTVFEQISDLTGGIKELPSNLDLVLMKNNDSQVHYYDTGTYTSGKYQGYKRIIATFVSSTGVGNSHCDEAIYLTRDNVTYKGYEHMVGPDANNKKVEYIDLDLIPQKIPFSSNTTFSLTNGDELSTKWIDDTNCILETDLSPYTQLPESSFITQPYKLYTRNSLRNPLIGTTNTYLLKDEVGVLFRYKLVQTVNYGELTRNTRSTKYNFDQDIIFTGIGLTVVDATTPLYNSQISGNPDDPEKFLQYQLGLSDRFTEQKYMPDFSSLSTSDFEQIYKIVNKVPIYVLKDSPKASEIYTTRYKTLDVIFVKTPEKKPTYKEYIQKHPFIFLKDPFGRYLLYEQSLYR